MDTLPNHARSLAHTSTGWLDRYWSDDVGLIRFPSIARDSEIKHGVRETGPYAVGLFLRNQPGDLNRARKALATMASFQLDEPGAVYHGSFRRYPEEQLPGPNAVIWRDYDPNWRQFIGTTFTLVLDRFADRLDNALARQLERAIQLVVIRRDRSDQAALHQYRVDESLAGCVGGRSI